MQHAAFGVRLVESHPAGLRHAQTVPEDQEQQATVAGFVPAAALHGFNQPFNLAAGEVLSVAVIADRCSFFLLLRPFIVEGFSGRMPLKPA